MKLKLDMNAIQNPFLVRAPAIHPYAMYQEQEDEDGYGTDKTLTEEEYLNTQAYKDYVRQKYEDHLKELRKIQDRKNLPANYETSDTDIVEDTPYRRRGGRRKTRKQTRKTRKNQKSKRKYINKTKSRR